VEKHTTMAMDLSKTVFEIAVSDQPGRVCERKRLRRGPDGGLVLFGSPTPLIVRPRHAMLQ
jgi:hypothetical protein